MIIQLVNDFLEAQMKKALKKRMSAQDVLGLRKKEIKPITRKIVVSTTLFLVSIVPYAAQTCGLKGG